MENNVKKKKYITKPMYSRTLLYSIVNVTVEICYDECRGDSNEEWEWTICRNGKKNQGEKGKPGNETDGVGGTDRYIQQSYFIQRERNWTSRSWIFDVLDVTPDYLLLGSMKANDIPKNITDNLKLCTDEEVRFVEAMTQYMIEQHKK